MMARKKSRRESYLSFYIMAKVRGAPVSLLQRGSNGRANAAEQISPQQTDGYRPMRRAYPISIFQLQPMRMRC